VLVGYHPPMSDTLVVLLIVLVVVLVARGPKTLPQLGRMLGLGFRNARNEARSIRKGAGDPPDDAER
jgi:Sec-independent protein translocase protein TatA